MPFCRPPAPIPQALSVNWAQAWRAAGLYNSTAPANLRGPKPLGSYKSCGSASDLAKNFAATITPDAAKAGDNVKTSFDYVRWGGDRCSPAPLHPQHTALLPLFPLLCAGPG
jgi:hypothetical protein